ncbi:MAG: acetyltransferase [Thermoleophilia bacterium]|nr:acetyltransferase [Thermoleophilia bacterium]
MTADVVKERIFIFGASGHAKAVIDTVENEGRYEIALLIDDDTSLAGEKLCGYEIGGGRNEIEAVMKKHAVTGCIVAIGDNEARMETAAWLAGQGLHLVSSVHPSCQLARGVKVGAGVVIMACTAINTDAEIGDNVIVNTSASIDHDCRVGDGAHIAPGSTLCGAVKIGQLAMVGAGATVIPNVEVGAGVTVLQDVPDGVTTLGARPTGSAGSGRDER